MTFRILRQTTVGLRPVQQYVLDDCHPTEYRNYMAAQLEAARLRKELPRTGHSDVKFTVIGTKH